MRNILFILAGTLFSCFASAHGRWLLPSHTVISGDKAVFVALDMSISNDIFHADKAYGGKPLLSTKPGNLREGNQKQAASPLAKMARSTKLWVLHPDGSETYDTPIINLGRKSASAIKLEQEGTYRVDIRQDPMYYTVYKSSQGKGGRVFGIDKQALARMPKGAKVEYKVKLINAVHTYITRNQTSPLHTKAKNSGLELIVKTHPNDLFTGESTQVQALFEGKPLGNTEIKITRGNTRYRNNRELQTVTTNNQGLATVSWQQPGMYLLELGTEQQAKDENYDKLKHALYLTLEVFPE